MRGACMVFVVAFSKTQLRRRHDCVVGINWAEVSKDLCAVDAFPPKSVVRKLICFIPTEFLCKEPIAFTVRNNLWQ